MNVSSFTQKRCICARRKLDILDCLE